MDKFVTQHEIIYFDKDFGQSTIPPGSVLSKGQIEALQKELESLQRGGAIRKVKGDSGQDARGGAALTEEKK